MKIFGLRGVFRFRTHGSKEDTCQLLAQQVGAFSFWSALKIEIGAVRHFLLILNKRRVRDHIARTNASIRRGVMWTEAGPR